MQRSISYLLMLLLGLWLTGCPASKDSTEDTTAQTDMAAEPVISVEPLPGGSPAYAEASLVLNDATPNDDGTFTFDFGVESYELGVQTQGAPLPLANSGKGQHIHLIVDNLPYEAHYEPMATTDKLSEPGNHVVLAFLARSYHESVKNMGPKVTSYVLQQYQVGDGEYEQADFTAPHLFYSRPKGTYTGKEIENLLLDFYLFNVELSPNGNKVRATINGNEFLLDKWQPYVIKGLQPGELTVKLELIDAEGNLIPGPFNTETRSVELKAAEEGAM